MSLVLTPEDALIAAEEARNAEADAGDAAARELDALKRLDAARLKRALDLLPLDDAYLVQARLLGRSEVELAAALSVSQAAVCWRLKRLRRCLRVLCSLETLDVPIDQVEADLRDAPIPSRTRGILAALWRSRFQQKEAAKLAGYKSFPPDRFKDALSTMMEHLAHPTIGPYARDLARVQLARAWCFLARSPLRRGSVVPEPPPGGGTVSRRRETRRTASPTRTAVEPEPASTTIDDGAVRAFLPLVADVGLRRAEELIASVRAELVREAA